MKLTPKIVPFLISLVIQLLAFFLNTLPSYCCVTHIFIVDSMIVVLSEGYHFEAKKSNFHIAARRRIVTGVHYLQPGCGIGVIGASGLQFCEDYQPNAPCESSR